MVYADWLQTWLGTWCAQLRPKTRESYQDITSRIIVPSIGGIRLEDLTPEDLQPILSAQLRAGHSRQAQLVYTVLHASLRRAVRSRQLRDNPCDLIDKPSHHQQPTRALTEDEERRFAAAAGGGPYWPALALMLYAGLRRGECIALTWADVDFAAEVIRVHRSAVLIGGKLTVGQPKSSAGERIVPMCPALALALRAQREQLFARGLAARACPVVPGRDGGLIGPTCLRAHCAAAARRAGIPPITLHGLRHTFATRVYQLGLDVKSLLSSCSPSTCS